MYATITGTCITCETACTVGGWGVVPNREIVSFRFASCVEKQNISVSRGQFGPNGIKIGQIKYKKWEVKNFGENRANWKKLHQIDTK